MVINVALLCAVRAQLWFDAKSPTKNVPPLAGTLFVVSPSENVQEAEVPNWLTVSVACPAVIVADRACVELFGSTV